MKAIMMISAALMLAACGFHLKGRGPQEALPYQNWHISGGQLQQALEKALRRADGVPVAADKAEATVVVQDVSSGKSIYTVTRGALINEYLFELSARAQVYRNGVPQGAPFVVSTRHQMDYVDGEALGKQEEEAMIWQEMRRDAAEQIVRRLPFVGKP